MQSPGDTGRRVSEGKAVAAAPLPARGPGRLRSVRSRELADRIREEVLAGSFASGSLPGEESLTAAYGASRNTVRGALRLLVAEGLLVRRPGLGTRVAARKFAHGLDRLAGLAETLTQQGTIVSEVQAARWEKAPAAAARRLELEPGVTVLYLERLRLLDGEPLSLDSSYLTADIGTALVDADLRSRDVFALIEEIAAMPLGTAEVQVQAMALKRAVASERGAAAAGPGRLRPGGGNRDHGGRPGRGPRHRRAVPPVRPAAGRGCRHRDRHACRHRNAGKRRLSSIGPAAPAGDPARRSPAGPHRRGRNPGRRVHQLRRAGAAVRDLPRRLPRDHRLARLVPF